MATPVLNIDILDTHSLRSIALVDTSTYPPSWNTVAPTLEVLAPGHDTFTTDFTPSSLQVFTSTTLGVSCEWCDTQDLPDGIWTFKYSIYPAYRYYVEKTFVRVDLLQAKLDKYYLLLDFTQCDEQIKREDKLTLDSIQTFINGAIAAGNKCVNATFNSLYKKANTMLDNYINNKSCVKH